MIILILIKINKYILSQTFKNTFRYPQRTLAI